MASPVSISIDTSRFRALMADLAAASGVRIDGGSGKEGQTFVAKQCGLLLTTLINVTPPTNRATSREFITKRFQTKANLIAGPERDFIIPEGGKHGSGSVRWYDWHSNVLRGVAKDADHTGDSPEQLLEVLRTVTSRGMIRAGSRGKQQVKIWQKITVKASTLAQVIRRVIGHLGRQKAAWLPAYDMIEQLGGIAQTARRPAEWIQKHRDGARGSYQNGLQVPNSPNFTLINFAVGIGKAGQQINTALNIRAKAMQRDMILYLKGIKDKHGIYG